MRENSLLVAHIQRTELIVIPAFLPYLFLAASGLLFVASGFSRNADERGLISTLSAICFVSGLCTSLWVSA